MGKKAKLNIPMFAALVLLLLTMITTHMTSGLYARYVATASGEDSARVAKFDVSGVVAPVENEDSKYTLTVTNSSEVAVEYKLEVVLDQHLQVTIGDETKKLEGDATSVVFTHENWKLAPGAETQPPIEMTFGVSDWSGLTDSKVDQGERADVSLSFTVNVIAEQID